MCRISSLLTGLLAQKIDMSSANMIGGLLHPTIAVVQWLIAARKAERPPALEPPGLLRGFFFEVYRLRVKIMRGHKLGAKEVRRGHIPYVRNPIRRPAVAQTLQNDIFDDHDYSIGADT